MKQISAPLLLSLLVMTGCVKIPEGLTPVAGFESDRYLGTWYEIARLDHRFERGLTHVTADYSVKAAGASVKAAGASVKAAGAVEVTGELSEIAVINRGYDPKAQTWNEAVGRARFVESPETGYLKVSFFGPFFGAYIVFDLDPEYRWSLVTGPNRDYLWILSRTPQIDPALRSQLIARISAAGFDSDKLIFVEQENPPPKTP